MPVPSLVGDQNVMSWMLSVMCTI